MTPCRRFRGEQSGVSLMLVLVTLTIFGLLVPVLGQFGSVNGVSAYVVKGQRFDRYAADSAMQGAIAWAQATPTAGRANVGCPQVGTGELNASSPNFNRSASVRCQGFKGSGVPQETPSMPQYAVLALGAAAPGIRVAGPGNLATGGAWWSNSAPAAVTVTGGADVDATKDFVGGVGTCSGIDAAPAMCAPDHPGAMVSTPTGPAWAPEVRTIADVEIRDPFPIGFEPCDMVEDGVLDLEPGFYWDIDGLNDVGDGCGNGNGQPVEIRLAPGAYYFDFDFFDEGNTSAGSTAWTLDGRNVSLVGGSGADANGACDDGVELTFGSTSHLRVINGASADICPLDNGGQQLAVVGVTNGQEPQPGDDTSTAVDAVPVPNFAFEWPQPDPPTATTLRDADCIDVPGDCPGGSTVGGTLRGSRASERIVMRVPDPVPEGVKLRNLVLRLTHVEGEAQNNDLNRLTVHLEGLPAGWFCDGLTQPQNVPFRSDWATDEFRCTAGSNRPYFPNGPLRVVYQLQNGGRPDAESSIGLDQVELTANFTRPAVRSESGCVTTTGGNRCELLDVDQQAGGSVFVRGTVFAPAATMHLRNGGVQRTGFTRGVVVRGIQLSGLPNSAEFAPVSLPGGGSYTDRLVTFEARLDDGDDTATILSARVRFCDAKPEGGEHAEGCSGADVTPPRIVAWEPRR